ncbi:MAG: HD domain-containing protein [Roseivirga sp.]
MSYPSNPVDIGILAGFLAINLLLGLQAGRKIKSFREYAVGKKDFSTGALTATITATWIGGGFLFHTLTNIYTTGLQYIIIILGEVLCLLIIGRILAIRMGEFLNNISVAEAMGDLYGQTVRLITALSSILGRLGYLAIQFKVLGQIFAWLFGLEEERVIFLTAVIVTFYSALGGVRAVTITDVFQFVAFSIFIPILALVIWNNLEQPEQVTDVLTKKSIFSLSRTIGWNSQFLSSLSVMLYFTIPSMNPPTFQRVAMARDIEQSKRSFTYAAVKTFFIIMIVSWIAILLLADNSELEPQHLVEHMLDRYAYTGLKGLIAIGITAMAMSTADSDLNACSVLAVNDIMRPTVSSFKTSIWVTRCFSLGLGGLALLMALYEGGVLDLMLFTANFYMPIVTVPLLMAIFGFRGTSRAALVGMAAGVVTVLTWNEYLAHTDIPSFLPGMVANLVGLMGTHYLLGEEGGWVGIKDKKPLLEARRARQAAWQAFKQDLQEPFLYLMINLPTNRWSYALFGVYVLGTTFSSFFLIPAAVVAAHPLLYSHLTYSVLIFISLFLTYPAWPSTFKHKPLMAYAWPIGIGYLLFWVGTLLTVLSGFHQLQVIFFMLNLVLAALLISWPLLLTLALSGILLALGTLYLYAGGIPWSHVAPELQFRFIYSLPLAASLAIALYKYKQDYKLLLKKREIIGKEYVRLEGLYKEDRASLEAAFVENMAVKTTLREAKADELGELVHTCKALYKELASMAEESEQARELLEEFQVLNKRLTHTATHLVDLAERAEYVALKLEHTKIDDLLMYVRTQLSFSRQEKHVEVRYQSQQAQVECDVLKIAKMLLDSVTFLRLQAASSEAPILLTVEDTWLHYPLHSVQRTDYAKKVKAVRFVITLEGEAPPLAPLYTAKLAHKEAPSTSFPEREEAIVMSKRVINAHYGYWEVSSHRLMYVIPATLSQVRPEDMDLLAPKLYKERARADDTYPGAKEQEAALLQSISERTKVDVGLVSDAIEVIKDYHGPVKRRSGEPFYLHPIAVAQIVLDYDQEEATILGALLHDTVEDTELSLDQVETRYGKEVRHIVDGVTHLESASGSIYRIKLTDNENIMQLIETTDKRILYVKLADRMHNMRTIKFKKYESQLNKANETIRFFVPLAEKLGLKGAARELEGLCAEVFSREKAS